MRRFLELGPGSALTEIATAFSKDWDVRRFDDFGGAGASVMDCQSEICRLACQFLRLTHRNPIWDVDVSIV